tara:strand:- start:1412 stop:2146 length:735 start_codon:yes stop_codon:yes gene_type:complete
MHIFDAYGKVAESEIKPTLINGRYEFQEEEERYILKDIIEKLLPQKSDRFLDIGCGSGDISYGISKLVSSTSLCDNKKSIERIKQIYLKNNFNFYPINFFDADFGDNKFDKILSYSVIQCLSKEDEIFDFLDKIIQIISSSGRALIGDIPNKDKLNRFKESERGKIFIKRWQERKKESGINFTKVEKYISKGHKFVDIDDKLILKMVSYIRSKNLNAYIYEQNSNLPFGNSREDILICSKEFYF